MSYTYREFVSASVENHENLCAFCLCENSILLNLKNCKHLYVLDNLITVNKIRMLEYGCICYLCHHFLIKIHLFRSQVEESLNILSNQSIHLESVKNMQKMQLTGIEISSNIDEDSLIESDFNVKYEVSAEVKIENDQNEDSDIDNDIPLSEIKKESKEKKMKRKPLKKYDGKISVIELSREDVMIERENDKSKEMYLKLPYKCELCITGFDHEANLAEHIEKRHTKKDGSFTCDICKSVLSSENSYKEHNKRHYRKYECIICGKRYVSLLAATQHYSQLHDETLAGLDYQCSVCSYTTRSYRQFRYHRDKHKHKQECTICGNTFVNKTGLKVHMFSMHQQSDRMFRCELCDKAYTHKSSLLSHMASIHTQYDGAYCVKCDVRFKSENGLRHHLKTHSSHISDSDKKFVCVECGSKFLTNTLLKEHMDWVHLKQTKHRCTNCSKVFKNGAALKKHKNFVHEKKRPPRDKICDYCGKGFTTLSILRVHIRAHSGARPLACATCGAAFAHPAALYTHQQRHARVNVK